MEVDIGILEIKLDIDKIPNFLSDNRKTGLLRFSENINGTDVNLIL